MPVEPVQMGLDVLDKAQAGQFAEIRDMFVPSLRAMVSADVLRVAWAAEIDRNGAVSAIGQPVCEPDDAGMTVVRIPVTLERGALTVIVSVAGDWLAGIQLAPASAAGRNRPWQPPAYADPTAFDEQDVTIDPGHLAVGGTLSRPRGPGRWPAIVLLAGSGPMDRDETLGRNKPLRDLAWGLASRGVAVLRFDKVTQAHGHALADARDFTVTDEYVPHALAAIRLLRELPANDGSAIDAGRVFVLGHSLGGTVAPRVAAAEPAVAGMVILAGGAQPMYWAAVRQVRYLASLDPATAVAAAPTIEAMTRQAAMVDSPDLTTSTPDEELPFGVPAPYWLDLRDYDPVALAATLEVPMLVLQGGRDYQATVVDDLARWQDGLAGRPGVTVHVYDADNHFFFAGSGPSTPAELEPAQHMDPAVITDIVAWLDQH